MNWAACIASHEPEEITHRFKAIQGFRISSLNRFESLGDFSQLMAREQVRKEQEALHEPADSPQSFWRILRSQAPCRSLCAPKLRANPDSASRRGKRFAVEAPDLKFLPHQFPHRLGAVGHEELRTAGKIRHGDFVHVDAEVVVERGDVTTDIFR